MKTFKQLGLSNNFIAVLKKLKITSPTEIQERAIPYVLKGKDVVASAATGSGKTLAFVSGILENMQPSGKSRVLVLTPTRELAEQVSSEFRKFATKKFKVFAVYGGTPIQEHIRKIKNSDIVVATPGRLLDLIQRQAFYLKDIEVLILDEFDRMLDMGFSHDVDLIIRKCPKQRQTLLFSATNTGEIKNLIDWYTKNAKQICIKSHLDSSILEQIYYDVLQKEKLSLFYYLIKKEKSNKTMVFCSTRINTEFIAKSLQKLGIDAKIIHGGLEQRQRTRTLKKFHQEGGILVCTDVAARGLDIKGITHIYNYDLPRKSEDYIHRIGRTARAGKEGKAITILTPKDYDLFEKILELPNVNLQEMDLPIFERINKEFLPILKKRSHKKTHTSRKQRRKKGIQWESVNSPELSNRFKKRTVPKDSWSSEEYTKKAYSKGARTSTKQDLKIYSKKRHKTSSSHRPAKGTKVKRGRAGKRPGTKKIKRRAKGRSNRKSKR
ncbi:MAG: DEAD/DEAH box helicase [Nanoarchaeota archaeon]|nr:DEAD/DEAH box helicase [Nanoarchaeota archaeon]